MIDPLPAGWRLATIQAIAGQSGVATDGDWVETKDQDPDGDVRLIQLADIGDGQFLNRSSRYMTMEAATRLKCTFLELGDLLVARMPDPLGRACIFPGLAGPAVTAVDVFIWRGGKDSANASWLMHVINSPEVRATLSGLAGGTTRQRVSGGNIKRLEIPVPPVAEQHRIVARIEALFARIRRARADLERIAPLSTHHRCAVLAREYEGNYTAACEQHQLVPLSECVTDFTYGTPVKCSRDLVGEVPVLRIPNVAAGRISLDDLKFAALPKREFKKLALEVGDILIVRSNGSPELVGRPALVEQTAAGMAFAGYLIRARPRRGRVYPPYLLHMLSSPSVRAIVELNVRSSSGVHNINAAELAALKVPLPSIDEQKRAARRIEQITAHAFVWEAEAGRSLALLDRLEQSILSRAFRGELVPQDVALSANELLDLSA